jgi:uncharacterized membrane protein
MVAKKPKVRKNSINSRTHGLRGRDCDPTCDAPYGWRRRKRKGFSFVNGTPLPESGQSLSELTRRNVQLIGEIEKASEEQRTFAERVADVVAACIGSWAFLIVQTILLIGWMVANVVGWWQHWDPYPFILLNLALSFQAAYAMPLIMISQNRQSRLSDQRNHLDLQINLLAEQENTEQLRLLRLLCEKAGISVGERQSRRLEEATQPDEIVRQICESVGGRNGQT